jgi:ABC-type Fe3+ transport system permease subunit
MENEMQTIKSLKISSMVWYGFVLVAFWTFVIGLYYWILGWIFGAQSWWIDMDLVIWTEYTLRTFLSVLWQALLNGVGGALAGLVVALVYNAVAGMMGGIKIELE